ncbi:hypothetical protein [Prochlorothrix hollandica]|uniref:hypothetical protein n=1 Tax=Prochlorothrix hollandica TaxID=1223 RepID=UPI003341BFDE
MAANALLQTLTQFNLWPWLHHNARVVLTLDRRSLALFRILLGLILLADLITRAGDLRAHYTDWGVLPRSVLLTGLLNPWHWSLHLSSGLAVVQALLFALAGLAALGLILGYRTQTMVLISWILLLSLHNRNPLILNAGDVELRLLLFWGFFLPLGDRFSLDQALGHPPKPPPPTQSAATFGLLLQISLLYWVSAAFKTDPVWRSTGEAVYYALSLDQLVTPVGLIIYQFPNLMKVSTFVTFWLELLGPLLLWSPIKTSLCRGLGVLIFVMLHMGFHLSLDIGLFGFIGATAWIAFIPGKAWEQTAQKPRLRRFYSTLITLKTSPALTFIKKSIAFGDRKQTPQQRSRSVSLAHKLLRTLFILLCCTTILSWNCAALPQIPFTFPPTLQPFAFALGLDQNWKIFAPGPPREDGWYVIPGSLKNGTTVDIFRGGKPVVWAKPLFTFRSYKNEHWRKYLIGLWSQSHADQRLHYGRYLCRRWNENRSPEDPKYLQTFEILFMLEKTLPDYKTEPIQPITLWQHNCG